MVGSLSTLEANDPHKEQVAVWRWECSEVPQTDIPNHTPVEQGFHHLCVSQAHSYRERGIFHIVLLELNTIIACPRESDPLIDLWHDVGVCVGKTAQVIACIYVCPAASITSGEVGSILLRVRSRIISVYICYTVISGASYTVTMTVIIFANPSSDSDTMTTSSAYSIPQTMSAHLAVVEPRLLSR